MRKLLLPAFLAAIGFAHYAQAATTNFSMTFTGPNSNPPTCTEVTPAPALPVAVGTLVATCVITPSTWSGMLSPLAGADGGLFTAGLSGTNINLNVGSSPITVNRTYNISITTTP
jgi:hypothetical protein